MADQEKDVVVEAASKTPREVRKEANAGIDNFRYLHFPTDRSGRLGAIKDAVKAMSTIGNRDTAANMIESLTTMAAWVARAHKSNALGKLAKAAIAKEQGIALRIANAKESVRAADDLAKQASSDAKRAVARKTEAAAELEEANGAS